MALHRAGKANAERFREKLQWQLPRRVPQTLFSSLAHARAEITKWQEDYNRQRPHSSLGNITPYEFATKMKLKKQAA